MAANSLREQIILNVISTLEGVASITTVQRTRPAFNDREELNLSSSNLPIAVVVGGDFAPEGTIKDNENAGYAFFTTVSTVKISVYADATTSESDSIVSSLLDDIWAALHVDLTRGGIALMTEVEPNMDTTLQHPYVIFHVDVNVTYEHGIGSI